MRTGARNPRSADLAILVVGRLSSRAAPSSPATSRSSPCSGSCRLCADLGHRRAARWATTPSATSCSSASACMPARSCRSGSSTTSRPTTPRGRRRHGLHLQPEPFLSGARCRPSPSLPSCRRSPPRCSGSVMLRHARPLLRDLHARPRHRRRPDRQWLAWIGGGSGMVPPYPPHALGDLRASSTTCSLALAVVTFLVLRWLYRTRFGLAVNAIRDDEDKAEAMGLRPPGQDRGLGDLGLLPRHRRRHPRQPRSASSIRSTRPSPAPPIGVWMVLMAILGGKGTLWGPVIGAVIFQVITGAVLDLSARLAARRARPADRGDRGLLPAGHHGLAARALARALRSPRSTGAATRRRRRPDERDARGQQRLQGVWRRRGQPRISLACRRGHASSA